MRKVSSQNICLCWFAAITVFYILTRWLIFKGFNGTDDLHYAMLAAKMLSGDYNPFQPGDIFSGRILLIVTQAAMYKLAGINTITTQAWSLIIVILCCYLTIFKLLPERNGLLTVVASCLFYFNPVITYVAVGVIGDIYVMLGGILICILLRSWIIKKKDNKRSLITGTGMAFLMTSSLLYKETILVFIPFVCAIAYAYERHSSKQLIISMLAGCCFIILLYGCVYFYYTGDAFFRISQIKNSSYLHHCSYDVLPFKYLLVRLTYGVWQEFTAQGFYPVIFGAFFSVFAIYRTKKIFHIENIYVVFFTALLLILLYAPFSLRGYQPLCSDARQFIPLLPLGVLVTTNFISHLLATRKYPYIFATISFCIALICIFSTGNKWQWMIYTLLCLYAVIKAGFMKSMPIVGAMALSLVLWLSILEHLFFKSSDWFRDMAKLNKQLIATHYYFPEHDNMMHWQLLHQFNHRRFSFYNLEKRPFKVFKLYYQAVDTASFHSGWLIINRAYSARSALFLQRIDSLQKTPFTRKVTEGDMSALLIDNMQKLSYFKQLIQEDSN